MPLSEYDRQNFHHVMVAETWFTAHLLRLIAKADNENRERIRKGFPEEVAAYEWWHGHGEGEPIPPREELLANDPAAALAEQGEQRREMGREIMGEHYHLRQPGDREFEGDAANCPICKEDDCEVIYCGGCGMSHREPECQL